MKEYSDFQSNMDSLISHNKQLEKDLEIQQENNKIISSQLYSNEQSKI